ncbi:hypothetical protein DBT_1329 [Dissulfuribacter thermophilus]|uniref:Uncharacterized protein n=1 Tax=Dissulfuribacter thermophilus TaxID=1156395 RepID=A0A1B9F5L2_9BACT|nr:hypothetical protein DBT_1329 [Dissulfuribacter thermophilus]
MVSAHRINYKVAHQSPLLLLIGPPASAYPFPLGIGLFLSPFKPDSKERKNGRKQKA